MDVSFRVVDQNGDIVGNSVRVQHSGRSWVPVHVTGTADVSQTHYFQVVLESRGGSNDIALDDYKVTFES